MFAQAETNVCGSMLSELQTLWDEIGETDNERDKILLQLEQECLDVYRRKIDHTKKQKASLHQALAEAEAAASSMISALGERELFTQVLVPKGTLREQVAAIKPRLEDLKLKRETRLQEFMDTQIQITRLCAEISGNSNPGSASPPQVDERDLTLKKLSDLKLQLQELQKDKSNRLQKVNQSIKAIHDLSVVMSMDFGKIISEIHPCFEDNGREQPKSISNDTLARLAGTICSLTQEKENRLKKLQNLGSVLTELWNLMDTSCNEKEKYDHVISLISYSPNTVLDPGALAQNVIEQTEIEIERLNALKASKAKELVLKKQRELEEIYRGVHMEVDGEATREMLINLIDSGHVDLFEQLSNMDDQIAKAHEEAQSRKDILDRVEKWKIAYEEENWLEDYERDQNRYSAGRGAHKNLKRAEKARMLVNKIPTLVESLVSKIQTWEKEKGTSFLYDKARLLDLLEEYSLSRQQREEEKRRSREQKKVQDLRNVEQEVLYGSRPSPMRLVGGKKPLGPISNSNIPIGTPTDRRASTPFGRPSSMLCKERKERGAPMTPINYVALAKDEPTSR